MRITIESTCNVTPATDRRASIEVKSDDLDIYQVLEEIEGLLILYGFNPETVKDGIMNRAEEIEVADADKAKSDSRESLL